MKLTEHFSTEEFEHSEVAARFGLINAIPPELIGEAKETAEMMEGIRAALGGNPIQVTSAWRSPDVNRRVGSRPTSDHLKMKAVDFVCPGFGSPLEVAQALGTLEKMDALGIGQLIYEYTWIHVSRALPANPINRILSIQGRGSSVSVGIQE